MTRSKQARLGVAISMLILAAACGTKRSANARPEGTAVTIAVQNNNWNTIVVYAISHGLVLRLGEVTTGNTVNLKTPRGMDPMASDFRLRIDPVGSRGTYTTPRIALGSGQTVTLRVENQLSQTSFSVL